MNIFPTKETETLETFKRDVLTGLTSSPKHLYSKYFYDKNGDIIFQKIMNDKQYYLTNTELGILKTSCDKLLDIVNHFTDGFDLIELGAGNALKSVEILNCFTEAKLDFTYYPIDISDNIIRTLEKELPAKINNLNIKGFIGEYFTALQEVCKYSHQPKLVLFLGANIGNMSPDGTLSFCMELHKNLAPGDRVLIGFDLIKNPWIIFNAYNDTNGLTKEFNLNLLKRINRELSANINLHNFDHYESYEPETGACKSYLFSLVDQSVIIENTEICFAENELIFMETSQKYTMDQINRMAAQSGFKPITRLVDSKTWFTDVIWERL